MNWAVIIGLVMWVVITLVLFYRLFRIEEQISVNHYEPEWVVQLKALQLRVRVLEDERIARAQKTLKGKKNA